MAQFDYNSKFEDIGVPRQDWVEQEINNTSYTSEYENQESPRHAQRRKEQKKTIRARNMSALQETLDEIRLGLRVLILMRGLPGSGKSTLAQTILQHTIGHNETTVREHILSTDDYFVENGVYIYDSSKLPAAHGWNHQRANRAMSSGYSPVIIDNTNTAMWEMKPYAIMATDYGYIVRILEPCTDWSFNPKELYRRNTHQVPLQNIRQMLTRYEKNVTQLKLFSAYGLAYKRLQPPQYRHFPSLSAQETHKTSKQSSVDDILFENGESSCLTAPVLKPMQQSVSLFDNLNAWGIDEAALRSWDIVIPLEPTEPKICRETPKEQKLVEMKNAETETTVEDFDVLRNIDREMMRRAINVYLGHNRDINPNYLPTPPGMVKKRSEHSRGSQTEESHEANMDNLQLLFPNISPKAIFYWYKLCTFDFNWTVEMFLNENAENINAAAEETEMASENSGELHQNSVSSETSSNESKAQAASSNICKPKCGASEESEALKRMVESKITIAPEHYSEHLRKVKFPFLSMDSDGTESDSENFEAPDSEETMELNLGEHLVQQLEKAFGDPNFLFPKGFQPVVQMPAKFARQLFTFYVESVCQQMDTQHLLEDMLKEDEEMASKMQLMEDLAIGPPCEPTEIPKIMKEQRWLSKLSKKAEKWKEETPDTLALKLTKDKLFRMFPALDKDDLLEILHAHNYNYKDTVETLIASTGSTLDLDENNARQPPIEPELIRDMWKEHNSCQQQNLHTIAEEVEQQEEWSPTDYRIKANELLAKRTGLYEKANRHYQSGNYEVARFYSGLAAKQTPFFEHYNSLAATAFLDDHSRRLENFNMLDLHFLYIKEAIPHLDMFLDRMISLMRLSNKKGGEIVQIITGRGKNSANGVAKIKPAVITRLKERGMAYVQLNPGLLKVRIKQNAKLTNEF